MTKYTKLIVAAVGLAAIVFGIDDATAEKVIAALTALAVYAFPNAPAE